MNGVDAERMRSALAELPDGTSHGEAPSLGDVYLPQSHLKALHPDVPVVTGMRGAGKTFWWGALQNEAVRRLIGERYARAKLSGNTVLRTGFGVRPAADEYPGKDVLDRLLQDGTDPRSIWRTVQAWQVARQDHPLRRKEDWSSRTAYVREHPEIIDRLFENEDARLNEEGRHFVVLYDALDRSADEWRSMYRIIRGLLRTALDMRSFRRIRMLAQWHELLADPTLADAILDRLVHNAYKLELKGGSMRKHHSASTMDAGLPSSRRWGRRPLSNRP